jgi:serine/threonine protein kinase
MESSSRADQRDPFRAPKLNTKTAPLKDPETGFEPMLPAEMRAKLSMIRRIGSGGAASVYLSKDGSLNREVAVKEPVFWQGEDTESHRRFLKEAQLAAQLEHRNMVPVYGFGYRDQDRRPFFIMRAIKRTTLDEAIRTYHHGRVRYRPDDPEFHRLLRFFVGACRGVAYAHSRGVVHRDPKPTNILLGDDGDAVVADWGLAKILDFSPDNGNRVTVNAWADPGVTEHGTIMGTPGYIAPELLPDGSSKADFRSDVYTLGAGLFEILTGRRARQLPPGHGAMEMLELAAQEATPRACHVNSSVPQALDNICAHAMARDPANRYSSASAEDHLPTRTALSTSSPFPPDTWQLNLHPVWGHVPGH